MDLVKEGKLFSITYQTAWGRRRPLRQVRRGLVQRGKKMPLRLNLARHIITAKDVAGAGRPPAFLAGS